MLVDFITKTQMLERNNHSVDYFWPVGIDYGFSAIKGFAPNKVFCFPNCAIKIDPDILGKVLDVSDTDMVYRCNGETWIVGEKAYSVMTGAEAMNYESEMYERNRYFSPSFRVLMDVGLGMAIASNAVRRYKGENLVIETGLPPKYKDNDSELLREALAGDHEFDLRIGKGRFLHYRFQVRENGVYIIDQPMGSLISAITDNDGRQSPADSIILKSNTIVMDPGFKTLDIYDISAGMFRSSHTFDTLGMYEIFKRTASELNRIYKADVSVAEMQALLRKGYVTSFDRKTMQSRRIPFDDVLIKNSNAVCDEALGKIFSIYNYLRDHDNLILTGGTGNAWEPIIRERFSNMESLRVISANKNDPGISNTFSNVRGYYLFLVSMLERQIRK